MIVVSTHQVGVRWLRLFCRVKQRPQVGRAGCWHHSTRWLLTGVWGRLAPASFLSSGNWNAVECTSQLSFCSAACEVIRWKKCSTQHQTNTGTVSGGKFHLQFVLSNWKRGQNQSWNCDQNELSECFKQQSHTCISKWAKSIEQATTTTSSSNNNKQQQQQATTTTTSSNNNKPPPFLLL